MLILAYNVIIMVFFFSKRCKNANLNTQNQEHVDIFFCFEPALIANFSLNIPESIRHRLL